MHRQSSPRSPSAIVRTGLLVALIAPALAGCPSDDPRDPCAVDVSGDGGSVEIGLGEPFTPIVDGTELDAQIGLQGLYMYIVNARVTGLDLAAGDEGAVDMALVDQGGRTWSLETGCRGRTFVEVDGHLQFDAPYFLALVPEAVTELDGTVVTLSLSVTDAAGLRASATNTFTARVPMASGAR